MIQVLQAGWSPIGDWPKMGADKQGFFATGLADTRTYVGGMPVGLITTGFTIGGDSGEIEVTAWDISGGAGSTANFLGLLYNNCVIDTRRGTGDKNAAYDIHDAIPTIVPAPCYVKLWKGQSASTDFPASHDVIDDRAPFLDDTWGINDLLYVEENADMTLHGRLSDTAGTVQTTPIGRVLRAPASLTDYMIALFWLVPTKLVQA